MRKSRDDHFQIFLPLAYLLRRLWTGPFLVKSVGASVVFAVVTDVSTSANLSVAISGVISVVALASVASVASLWSPYSLLIASIASFSSPYNLLIAFTKLT